MLNRSKHEIAMRRILQDIYSQPEVGRNLGFKGGTACMFFHGLPRFSTDLDFSLLGDIDIESLQKKMVDIVGKHGKIRDNWLKLNTLFLLLEHTEGSTAIKIEISIRDIEKINKYELLEFYGTPVKVMTKSNIFANKLFALRNRPAPTARDLFDINYFFTNSWDIDVDVLRMLTDSSVVEYLSGLPQFIRTNFNARNISTGLNELLDNESSRDFVKNKLIDKVIREIDIYIDSCQPPEKLK